MDAREGDTPTWIDQGRVRFTQDSIGPYFASGGHIEELTSGPRSGRVRADSVPPIRVVEREGRLYTLDNRRLEAFRRANVPQRYVIASPMEA